MHVCDENGSSVIVNTPGRYIAYEYPFLTVKIVEGFSRSYCPSARTPALEHEFVLKRCKNPATFHPRHIWILNRSFLWPFVDVELYMIRNKILVLSSETRLPQTKHNTKCEAAPKLSNTRNANALVFMIVLLRLHQTTHRRVCGTPVCGLCPWSDLPKGQNKNQK